MKSKSILVWRMVLAVVAGCCAPSLAPAGQIEMVLATSPGFPAMSTGDWYRMLVSLGVNDLQIRQATGTDKPQIESSGNASDPDYKVTGVLTSRNELILPGGKFSARDSGGLRIWLDKLRNEGAARAQGAPRLPFGFTVAQLQQVQADLRRPVDISTLGVQPRVLLERLGAQLTLPLVAQSDVADSLAEGSPLTMELKGVSAGTALSCALRARGLALAPRTNPKRQPEYVVMRASENLEAWPVGWPPKKPERDLLPGLFELVNVELEDIPLSQLLDVLGDRLKVPLLFDQAAIERQKIDVSKVRVSLPPKETAYAIVLNKTLAHGKLKYVIRVDDANKPVVWITTLLPN
jgi:hypothetical protein